MKTWDRLATIALLGLLPGLAAADPPSSADSSAGLEEIVVTAEKRESTVQKTPISITAYSGEALAAQGTTSMMEVAEETPGVSFRTSGAGQTEFEIRGLASSGGATATVGYYFDDVPISPPALGDIGKVAIDPNLYDVNRVEILRGPQGTLYGAGSMGGTIKIITNSAKLDTFEAAADGTLSGSNGGGFNRGINALMNVPLVTDKAALRVVVSSIYTDGWIDRIVENPFPFPTNTGCTPTAFLGCARGNVLASPAQQVIPRVNSTRLDSVRANVVVKPIDNLDIKATAMYQHTSSGGYGEFDSPPGTTGPVAHYQPYDTPEPTNDYVRLASVVAQYSFSGAQLSSSTSYWTRGLTQFQDGSELNENLYGLAQFYPGEGTRETDNFNQFAQEIRLSSTVAAPFQWLVGAFYSDLKYQFFQSDIDPALTSAVYATGFYAPVTEAQNPLGILYLGTTQYRMKQSAAFSELSYQFTPSLKLTVGGRYYDYRSNVTANQAGIFTQSVSAVPTIVSSAIQANGSNPKINLSYTPTDDLTVYGTIAKGFRPGGINFPLPSVGPNSCTAALDAIGESGGRNSYKADSVWSYELGEKARVADGRVTINGALYYIKWSDIQQLVPLACGYFDTFNVGNARSYGSELEVQAKLTTNWSISATGGYTNATINDPAPNLNLAPGTPVLNIPKYTGSGAITYARPLTAATTLMARAAATYFGALTDEAYTYVRLPGYTLVEARVGLVADRWSIYVTGANLTNKIAELSANNTSFTSNSPNLVRITTNQPRTIGLEATTKF
ncbi:MAG TPA: TonB-dependent receptor [Steroidobacteraceae bacterium]|nr:TonB-dependent receptor [Steroidobacteraceae bacterium]